MPAENLPDSSPAPEAGTAPEYGVVSYGRELNDAYLSAVQQAVATLGGRILELENAAGDGYVVTKLLVAYDGGIETLRLGVAAAASAVRSQEKQGSGEQVSGEQGAAGGQTAVVPSSLLEPARKLLVMDVDSTLIKQEVIELLAAHAGREAEVAAVTEAAMRGDLDFAQSLHHRVKALAGLPVSVIDEVGARIELSDGAEALVKEFLSAGHAVAVVSGGFSQVLDPLAARLQLTHARANLLGIAGGVLTGSVEGPVVDRAVKARSLREWAAGLGIEERHTIAVGDGANDLDMLAAAALGVAFNAKPAVQAAADAVLNLPNLDVVQHFVKL
ncbi:phosphoserine phosphatase SerB [Arthrobacter jiangjiafuii]|uniref:phosphoserine phosphatase n=1 Tax=Arthrobacter jiangjiafuii TaxID=2817475 RepID=A0A975M2J9_9MICC|nr:phosphoserine phosphatase SerB [Arthrobacter jiangjiafuii]MBP3043176.1 phosphoserine phosphatase SerB [Arthrobacter jiangjiafuii]QWC08730.1 phosphoserine phosphatase SerB [Arthrobacter jiangjiafuii]